MTNIMLNNDKEGKELDNNLTQGDCFYCYGVNPEEEKLYQYIGGSKIAFVNLLTGKPSLNTSQTPRTKSEVVRWLSKGHELVKYVENISIVLDE